MASKQSDNSANMAPTQATGNVLLVNLDTAFDDADI